jgi:hypothetical protein
VAPSAVLRLAPEAHARGSIPWAFPFSGRCSILDRQDFAAWPPSLSNSIHGKFREQNAKNRRLSKSVLMLQWDVRSYNRAQIENLMKIKYFGSPASALATLILASSSLKASIDVSGLEQVPPENWPKTGTFYFAVENLPPLPCPPSDPRIPVYAYTNGMFVVDDSETSFIYDGSSLSRFGRVSAETEGGEGDGPAPGGAGLRNSARFASQGFSVVDTNFAASTDTNLYQACLSFPSDTNTLPTLQIRTFGTNAVLIKANHFDYSAETNRDFALLVCDSPEKPVWKNVDFLGLSDAQDGWVIQGTVPRREVSNPMFLLISNVQKTNNAFFRAIPYGGPQVQLAGAQAYDIVSNTIVLQATVTDLSGVAGVTFDLNVDGLPARYVFGTNSTIQQNTKYNPNGINTVYLYAYSTPRTYDPASPPDQTKLFFSGFSSLPLDFENDTYLLFASDYASPEIGTNYIYYVIDKAQTVQARIYNPANNQTLASFSGYVPYPATIVIPWNFTQADGNTPYTNDTYGVHFTAFDPTDLDNTNNIDRNGVRTARGCYLTYAEEDPFEAIYGMGNTYLNDQANTWIKQNLKTFYQDLYAWWSDTAYTRDQVGTNRNYADCTALDADHVEWSQFMAPGMSNSFYSDLTIAQAHGNGIELGGGRSLNRMTSFDLKNYVLGYRPGNKTRLRKATIWSCFSASVQQQTGALGFVDACGIRPTPRQMNSYMRKNCGFFIGEKIDAAWNDNGHEATTAEAAAALDIIWGEGQYPYPGGSDPTYSWYWAVRATLLQYPHIVSSGANPLLAGYPNVIFSSVYEDELLMLNTQHVKQAR